MKRMNYEPSRHCITREGMDVDEPLAEEPGWLENIIFLAAVAALVLAALVLLGVLR